MCGIEPNSSLLLWIFVTGSVCMAVLARKLSDHLLVPPPQPTHWLFRRKIHIRPSYLLRPDRHFDGAGQPWAWRYIAVSTVTLAAGALALYAMTACR